MNPNPNAERPRVTLPRIVSRDEWLVARKQLLAKEKDLDLTPLGRQDA